MTANTKNRRSRSLKTATKRTSRKTQKVRLAKPSVEVAPRRTGRQVNLDNYVQVVYGVVEGEDISLAERTRHLYTYRTDGKKYAIGDIVTVPPTSRTGFTGDPVVVTVIKKGSTYKGPTHAVIRKHRHTFKTIYVCECGKTHE